MTPLHPLVVPLIEAFVHSVINPVSSGKSLKNKEAAFTLRGFTDAEVMSVFAADQQACVRYTLLPMICVPFVDIFTTNIFSFCVQIFLSFMVLPALQFLCAFSSHVVSALANSAITHVVYDWLDGFAHFFT